MCLYACACVSMCINLYACVCVNVCMYLCAYWRLLLKSLWINELVYRNPSPWFCSKSGGVKAKVRSNGDL